MTARHWTEDELLAHLYGIGPENGHIEACSECARRLQSMQEARSLSEAAGINSIEPSFEFLAAQRRRIYQRLSKPPQYALVRRFAPAIAASLAIAGGLLLFEEQHSNSSRPVVKPADTELVEDVGRTAMNPEPAPLAPLQALFEE
jgi:anti-sigma factor RsiW